MVLLVVLVWVGGGSVCASVRLGFWSVGFLVSTVLILFGGGFLCFFLGLVLQWF